MMGDSSSLTVAGLRSLKKKTGSDGYSRKTSITEHLEGKSGFKLRPPTGTIIIRSSRVQWMLKEAKLRRNYFVHKNPNFTVYPTL